MKPTRDHFLPPDLEAFRLAQHPRGRVIVIAPTRAACETIEMALHTHVDTLLEREHGEELRTWAREEKAFGIVAGTGTGKTLGIRPIAEEILHTSLRVGVVNREREATPETPLWNVVIVTTGIARRWFQYPLITSRDTLVVDEIHQTSAELELVLALGKRAGCRFIWLSATVDPSVYARYLESDEVLETSAFDSALRATVTVVAQKPAEFLNDRYVRRIIRERRGVAVFVPTRAEVEQLAEGMAEQWRRLTTAFYHGGEPIRVIRPFLEGEVERPWLLAMTAAGQSALNVRGLDTVVIYDARYGIVVDRGRNVLHRLYLGANEILQMAGRVHGRVPDGEVTILSDRKLVFDELRPGPPDFQLAGDAERVAMTCAALGVDATELDLPVPLDRIAYRRAMARLVTRGLVAEGRLTPYGRAVEALPVERPWGELLVHADRDLIAPLAVAANIDSLHRMTRDDRDLHGLVANGSDHLTAYNIYTTAVNEFGRLGEVYGLPRHLFDETLEAWAAERGVLVKALEDAALGMAAVYRSLELPLPATLSHAGKAMRQAFADLVARIMPFDLVMDQETAAGEQARVSRTSFAGDWGAIAGSIRYFADRFGTPRAAIEGTTISYDLVSKYATRAPPTVEIRGPRKRPQLVAVRAVEYHGFTLDVELEPLDGDVPEELRPAVRDALVAAVLAGSTDHHDQGRLRRAAGRAGELYRRSGGSLEALGPEALRVALRRQLDGVDGWKEFHQRRLQLTVADTLAPEVVAALDALPDKVHVLGDTVPLGYEVESGSGVARLHLREGQARRLRDQDLPMLDRPLRFAVAQSRGPELRAASLEDLREQLRHRRDRRGAKRRLPRRRRK